MYWIVYFLYYNIPDSQSRLELTEQYIQSDIEAKHKNNKFCVGIYHIFPICYDLSLYIFFVSQMMHRYP